MIKTASMPPYWQEILPSIRQNFPSQYGEYLSKPEKIEFVSAPESGVSGDPYAYIKLLEKKPGMTEEEVKTLDVDGDGKIDIVFLVVPKIERDIIEEFKRELPEEVSQKTIHQIITDPNIQEEIKNSVKEYVSKIYRHLILHELGHKESGGVGGEASADAFAERFKLAGEDSMLKRLVKMANHLDSIGQKTLADELDRIIVLAQTVAGFDPSKRYDYKKTDLFGDLEKTLSNVSYDQIKSEVTSSPNSLHYIAEVGTSNFIDLREFPEFKSLISRLSFGPITLDDGKRNYVFEEELITAKPPSLSDTPSVITELSGGTIKDKVTGDAFRAWTHENHPAEAKQMELDPPSDKTKWDNQYVLKALRVFEKEWLSEAPMAIAKFKLLGGKPASSINPLDLPRIDDAGLAQKIKETPVSSSSDITQQHMRSVMEAAEESGTSTVSGHGVIDAVTGMNPLSARKMLDWLDQRRPGQPKEQLRVLRDLASLQGASRDSAVAMLAALPGAQRFHPEEAKSALSFLAANKDKIMDIMLKAPEKDIEEPVFKMGPEDEMQKESRYNQDLINMFKKNLSTKSTLVRR